MTTDKYSLHWNLARDSIVYLPLPTTSAILLGESSNYETSLSRHIISRKADWIIALI